MSITIHHDNMIFVPFNPNQGINSASQNIFNRLGMNTYLVGAPTTPYVQGGFMATLHEKYPEMVDRYVLMCANGEVKIGDVVALNPVAKPDVVYLFCALHKDRKDFPTAKSLQACMIEVVALIQNWAGRGFVTTGVATYKLGCGSTSKFLEWGVAGHIMSFFLSKLEVPVVVYIGTHNTIPAYALKLKEEALGLTQRAQAPVVTVRTVPLPPLEPAYTLAELEIEIVSEIGEVAWAELVSA